MEPPLLKLRRSAAELVACAVLELFPGTKLVGGEADEIGFFYDFVIDHSLPPQAITLVEEKVRELAKQNHPFKILDMMRENAAAFFLHHAQPIKAEAVSAASQNILPLVQIGGFYDYAPGRHVSQSAECGVVKIFEIQPASIHLPVSGGLQVVRFRGGAFENPAKLKKFIKQSEAAKKRDHRLLGREMGLFALHEEVGGVGWFWHPKGAVLRELLLDWWRNEHRKQGFQPLASPRVVKPSFMKMAGFFNVPDEEARAFPEFALDGANYLLSPIDGAAHAWAYRTGLRSYRELPVKYAEYGQIYNNRKPGDLRGMFRAREFCADIAHLFCTPEQADKEIISSLQFIDKTVKMLGFEYRWYLIPRGEKYAGTLSNWDTSLDWLSKALKACGFDYQEDAYHTSFAGPRIEVRLVDALGREWKGSSLAIDFNLPEQMGLRYQGADDEMHVPVMLARSMFGSLECFVAILIEHYAGQLPLWLAPEQVRVIPVGDKSRGYADTVREALIAADLRAACDERSGTLGSKVHAAERERVPYLLIVGDKESKTGTVTVRTCGQKGATFTSRIEEFLQKLQEEVAQRALPSKTSNRSR